MKKIAKRTVRQALPPILVVLGTSRRTPKPARAGAWGMLGGLWALAYHRYRRGGRAQTAREWELLRSANWDAFTKHYNEAVPTIEEEFDIWGEYHQHRHEMRYDLVAAEVRRHLPTGGAVLDVGCGSALVADRLLDLDAHYVGIDFGGHHTLYASKKLADADGRLRASIARGQGEALPFASGSFDVVVMSEVIEHLLRPELAVWEVARVLRPGGVFIMTTNNASEVPLKSPLSNPVAWLEKALGATRPDLISLRPWVWPEAVPNPVPGGSDKIYLPHTHHIQAETRAMFSAAGMDTFRWSTFEFPPPQSATARWLDGRGEAGRRIVDVIEAVATRTPLVKRLGCHVFMTARKQREAIAPEPPSGLWPGPFSGGRRPHSGAGARPS
jgi:ubiquinone/menaquinone biosynthesis C-methylase UbiE